MLMRAADTETALIQAGVLAPPLACLTYTEDIDADPELIHGSDPACERHCEETLLRKHVGANWAYDLAVMGAQFPDLLPLIFEMLDEDHGHDILINQKLYDIGDGCYRVREIDEGGDEPVFVSVRYGLTDVHARYFGEHLEKDKWRLQYGRLRHLPLSQWDEGAKFYAKNDATATLRSWYAMQMQKRRVPNERYLVNAAAQVRAAFAFQLIACWGIQTDGAEVQQFMNTIATEQAVRREVLQREGLVSNTGSRTKKIASARMRDALGHNCVLTKTGLENYWAWWNGMKRAGKQVTIEDRFRTKLRLFEQGYVSLAQDVCHASGDKLLVEYAKYGQFQTLFTKVSKLRTGGYPIQTSFETLLETGRASSYASKIIPNSAAIMNLPRKEGMRECFVPRNFDIRLPVKYRNVLIACDYRMAELVSLSQITYSLFGYSKMRDALNAGIDPHLDLAAMFMGISYDEALRRQHEPEVKRMRQMSKAYNFGKPGMLGDENFIAYAKAVYGVDFAPTKEESLEKVHHYTRLYFRKWPEIKQYKDWIWSLVDQSPNRLIDIQQFMSKRLRGKLQAPVAANSLFQGLTADGFKAALWAVQKRCYVGMRVPERTPLSNSLVLLRDEPIRVRRGHEYWATALHGARVVAPVHDEILLECRETVAHEAAQELLSVMCEEYQQYTPDVTINGELSMMRRWSKDAATVYRDGRLIPWEDDYERYSKKSKRAPLMRRQEAA